MRNGNCQLYLSQMFLLILSHIRPPTPSLCVDAHPLLPKGQQNKFVADIVILSQYILRRLYTVLGCLGAVLGCLGAMIL